MKHKKRALFQSVLALILCLSMLVGTTFAWFTDSVTSGSNIIQAGNLDIGMEWTNDLANPNWQDASEDAIFNYENWEPGYTDLKYLRITNEGNLAFQYQLTFDLPDTTTGTVMDGGSDPGSNGIAGGIVGDGGDISNVGNSGDITAEGGTPSTPAADALKLAEAIDVYYLNATNEPFATREEAMEKLVRVGTLSDLLHGRLAAATGVLLPEESLFSKNAELPATLNPDTGSTTACIMLKMREDAGNEYMDCSAGGGFCVKVLATQYAYEEDAFGSDYDTKAAEDIFPAFTGTMGGTGSVEVGTDGKTTGEATIGGAKIPAGVQVTEGTTELTVSITEKSGSDANVQLRENEAMRSLDVHIEGVSADNTVPIIVDLGQVLAEGFNQGNVTLYHVENGAASEMSQVKSLSELDAHNEFYYDPATGNTTVAMATFSEVAVVADMENAWNGEFDYSWYMGRSTDYTIANADQLAAFGAIVGGMNGQTQDNFSGKTVKLIADVNLGDKESENNPDLIFYPIGYYNSTGSYEKVSGGSVTSTVNSFMGTFDGTGHTISNFYQNTWEMFGDYNEGYSGTPNYYKDAMGLFGYVYGGTVKNLTVDHFSSDGEFAPTGVIAAYADGNSTFENIAITNCNPRVYNTGNGGIIGIAGDTSTANDDHITLTNITVDNSNKISALWGSYDVACGGLVGMYRGNVDGSGNATGDTISFNNCHVAAQMDVYNDVCGNYQYYAYRYAGMIIGSIRHNTTNAEGKTIPNMTGISATGCTVNYGDWNDYYYCEFEENTMASYSEDYQFSRVPNSEIDTTNGKENATCIGHDHTEAEDKQAVYLPFHQLFTGYSWGVSSIGIEELEGIETDFNTDIEVNPGLEESVLKFNCAFPNTSINEETGEVQTSFLYRVGNQNNIKVSSLFATVDGATINNAGTYVRIDKVYDDADVTCTFTPAGEGKEWTEGTLKFEGTGVVDIVIQDYDFCTPTVLHLEVVDATNATSATSATKNNVVLLNDCNFSSLEVSGGYTLYGNGFTMTCGSDSVALDMGYSFVTLNNGTLDNVQIVCPNFDYAALYKSNLTSSDNRSETTNGTTRYYNAKSGVMASGNSQILNSRISGARAAVNISGGNCVIDNSRIELGAVASVLVGAANSVTLRDVTLVQKPTASTYDSNKKLMGFSVLMICNSDGNAAPVTLEGTLVQNAWVDENDKQYVPSAGQSIISTVLEKTEYLHDIDGDGTNESLNLGFAYMPESLTSAVNTTTITDNRTNKTAIPYDYAEVTISSGKTYVYSYKNSSGTNGSFKDEGEYKPNEYGDNIVITYTDTTEGLTTDKSFGTDGWVYELNVDLDKLSGYAVDFSKLSMSVNGVPVADFKVNSNTKPTSPVAVTAGGTTYTLTATIDGKEYTATFKVTGTEATKESPSLVASTYEAALLVGEQGNTSNKDTWHGAAPALEGIQVKYWSVAEKQYKTITLADYTPTTAGKQNGTNTTWTYSPANGDFTLTLNGGQVHSTNNVSAMPVVFNSKLYFVAAGSNGLVNFGNSARTIPVTYSFKDNNGGVELTFSNTWSIECANKDTCYDYSDFCDGKKTTFTIDESHGCVTPDTLITLTDGSQVRVDSLTGNEELLVWNLETGKLDAAPIMFVDSESEAEFEIVHLYFSDGTDVKVIYEHGFWDYDLNKYVYLDANADQYIGHTFAKQNGSELTKVKLTDVVIETETTTAWSPVTVGHLCYFVNGMLSMPGGVGGLFNIFDVNPETMTYDMEAMARDIETYGLFTYEELNSIAPLSEEMFNAAGGAYLKVSIGKGNLTMDELVSMINRYSKFFE